MVLAVLERRTKQLKLYNREVFAATVGGMRVVEPAADLAMALAVASGGLDLAMAPHLVAIGEVGLTGEVRRVGAVGRRLAEAARLGFRSALVPPGCGAGGTDGVPAGIRVIEVADLRAALQWAAKAAADDRPR
jgi:DNA repair protein RadA/Sms